MSRAPLAAVAAALLLAPACADPGGDGEVEPLRHPPRLVAHAGGGLHHRTYTNSLEAFAEAARNGFRLLEIDFEWTLGTDAQPARLVATHDWGSFAPTARTAGVADGAMLPPSYKLFLDWRRERPYTEPDLPELGEFLREHPHIDVVTDVKSRNLDGLAAIAAELPDLVHRFVPQIHHPLEWQPARDLGFERIILTLYVVPMSDEEVLAFARERRPWAVTMNWQRAEEGVLPRALDDLRVFTYAHTLNNWRSVEALERVGVDGVYTDWLAPVDDRSRARSVEATEWTATLSGPVPLDDLLVSYLPADDMPLELSFVNRSHEPRLVALEVFDRDGDVRGRREFVLEPVEVRRVIAQEVAPDRRRLNMVIVRRDPAVEVVPRLQSPQGTRLDWSLADGLHARAAFEGDLTGLAGQLLVLANPSDATVTTSVRLEVDGETVVDEDETVPPWSVRVRSVGFRGAVRGRAEVSGDPLVVQHLAWDTHLRFVR